MAFNRLADRHVDKANPRTKDREIPAGKVTIVQAWGLVVIALSAYFGGCVGPEPDLFYSFADRLGHFARVLVHKTFYHALSFFPWDGRGLAPVAGWFAVNGGFGWAPVVLGIGVMCWVAGFDTIYAVQDIEFDRRANLYSVPSLFGIKTSLRFAAALHFAAVIFFLLAGSIANLKSPFYILLMITCGLLDREHRLLLTGRPKPTRCGVL